jgi:hypothetical protein
VYVSSSDASQSGITTEGDVRVTPYAARKGGASRPLVGAAEPARNEYYPSISADDRLVAFTSAPQGSSGYNQPASELFIVPIEGGTSRRLAANDPPACAARPSPGIHNAWSKWGPVVEELDGIKYYWLVFSSTRADGKIPQLFMTGITVQAGNVTEHGAVYLWNQPATEGNHTPAWTTFQVPNVPK